MSMAEAAPSSKPCAHTLSFPVGQMHAHALSVSSKHMPDSVSQWHGSVGF
jgi:hypothetical protein